MGQMADAIESLSTFLGNRPAALAGVWDLYSSIVVQLCCKHHLVREGQPFEGTDAGQHPLFCDEARRMTFEAVTLFCNGDT